MDAERRDFAPGMMLGTYRLEHPLGRGGMGAVFLAYDTRLHHQVALKMITGDADDVTSSARLLREARNAAALNHRQATSLTCSAFVIASPLRAHQRREKRA